MKSTKDRMPALLSVVISASIIVAVPLPLALPLRQYKISPYYQHVNNRFLRRRMRQKR
ncbi:MAG: hypothetical protein AAB552_01060 [Patescibacteria group bacterium]